MRPGQTCQERILGPADRVSALRLVAGLHDLQHDEDTGAAGTYERTNLGIDQGISSGHAGSESRAAHDFRDEEGHDADAHETH